jgi:hypothetical protein
VGSSGLVADLVHEPMAAVTSTLADTPYRPRTCSMVGKSLLSDQF